MAVVRAVKLVHDVPYKSTLCRQTILEKLCCTSSTTTRPCNHQSSSSISSQSLSPSAYVRVNPHFVPVLSFYHPPNRLKILLHIVLKFGVILLNSVLIELHIHGVFESHKLLQQGGREPNKIWKSGAANLFRNFVQILMRVNNNWRGSFV